MEIQLVPEQYVDWGGIYCPVCGKGDIEGGRYRFDRKSMRVVQSCYCVICSARWEDEYKLVGYCNLVVKEK